MTARATVTGILVAVLAGRSLAAGPHPATPREFFGTVLWAPTGRPLANVRVELQRVRWGFPLQREPEHLGVTRTDARGGFRLVTTRPGPYHIVCFRPGPHGGSGANDVHPSEPIVIRYRPDPTPHR